MFSEFAFLIKTFLGWKNVLRFSREALKEGSHSITDEKIHDFPGPPRKIFQNLFRARKSLHIKKQLAAKVAKFISIPHCI